MNPSGAMAELHGLKMDDERSESRNALPVRRPGDQEAEVFGGAISGGASTVAYRRERLGMAVAVSSNRCIDTTGVAAATSYFLNVERDHSSLPGKGG